MSYLKRFAVAVGVVVGLVLSAGLLAALGDPGRLTPANQAAAETPSTQQTITVSGQGTVTVTPDTAQVTLGVQLQRADLATAQAEATTTMTAVIASLKQRGIDEAKIQTVNYSIYINYAPEKTDQTIVGYTVLNLVAVQVTPMTNVGQVIEAAVAAGANQVQNIGFSVENIDAAVRQARQQAMDDARAKAEQLAKLGGVTLGGPVSISEGVSTPIDSRGSMPAAVPAGAGAVPIQGGESTVTVLVTVSYGF